MPARSKPGPEPAGYFYSGKNRQPDYYSGKNDGAPIMMIDWQPKGGRRNGRIIADQACQEKEEKILEIREHPRSISVGRIIATAA
jgi:hypothetical protein